MRWLVYTGLSALALASTACPPGADPCRTNDDCHDNELCVEGVCRTACNNDLDCGRREKCEDGVCWPVEPDAGETAREGAADAARADISATDRSASDAAAADRSARDTWAPDRGLPADSGPPVDSGRADTSVSVDAGGPPPSCGTVGTLQDNFDDNAIGWQWLDWNEPGAEAREVSGQLRIALSAGANDRYASYSSDFATDLRGDALQVEVVQVPSQPQAEAYVDFHRGAEGWLGIDYYSGSIAASVYVNDVRTAFGSAAYSAAAHRFWQIREMGGRLTFATSPDAVTWSTLLDTETPAFASFGDVVLGAGAVTTIGAADAAIFDNVNTGRTPPPWCAASSLSDGFDDGSLSQEWLLMGPESCSASERDGQLQIAYAGGGDGADCWLWTRRLFAFDEVSVEVVSHPASEPNAITLLAVWAPLGPYAEIGPSGDVLRSWIDTGALLGAVPLQGRRWVRLRRAGGTIYFEARGDASAWEVLHSSSWGADSGPVYPALGLDCRDCGATARSASFDNYNID